MTANPLLQNWTTPFGIPPFKLIQDDQFQEALDHVLNTTLRNIESIAKNQAKPTFQNTIEQMELAEVQLNDVVGVFFNLSHSDSNEFRQKLEAEFSPKFAKYSSDIFLNEDLFNRIRELWEHLKQDSHLTSEQIRVLENYYKCFVRSGCHLNNTEKVRLKALKEQLASLHTSFGQKILSEEKEWFLKIPESEAKKLPSFLIGSMQEAAKERDIDGYVVTLNRSLIVPFLEHSSNRALRHQAYSAWVGRGNNDNENNTQDTIRQILALRHEMAKLLGFESYANYKLDEEMAKNPKQVKDLLDTVWQPARQKAIEDAALLQSMLKQDGFDDGFEPWDWRYYSQKRKCSEFSYDESKVKMYFQLENMIEAAFYCSTRLFGLTFKPLDVELYHPDCRAWEVQKDGRHLAIFIGDYFARPSKRSGAWCSSFRSQNKLRGEVRPVTINVCNFIKSAEGEPCLLSFDDTRTLFHEFGHALHAMLSDVTYESISGTSVVRDFVELPSQLFEHWIEIPEVLQRFATHAETNQTIPKSLLEKLLATKNYDMGFATVEYLASAYVDLAMHNEIPTSDPLAREAEILTQIDLPPAIKMRHSTTNFLHVFATSGYSSGYYSYLWSEVMDADAFEYFLEEGGPFNKKTAQRLEKYILSAGNSQKPEELYTLFRGQLPSADALLRKRGFLPA